MDFIQPCFAVANWFIPLISLIVTAGLGAAGLYFSAAAKDDAKDAQREAIALENKKLDLAEKATFADDAPTTTVVNQQTVSIGIFVAAALAVLWVLMGKK